MEEEIKLSCARPSGGSVDEQPSSLEPDQQNLNKEKSSMIKVGQKAPDFTAPAYHQGKFVNVNLSDYLNKWVLLCFYPGDFTFV